VSPILRASSQNLEKSINKFLIENSINNFSIEINNYLIKEKLKI